MLFSKSGSLWVLGRRPNQNVAVGRKKSIERHTSHPISQSNNLIYLYYYDTVSLKIKAILYFISTNTSWNIF